jgi:hypothetical protein
VLFERLLCVLCFLPAVFSLSLCVCVFLLSLARALPSFSLSVLFPPLFLPSSCNSPLSSIVASTPFVVVFFWFPSWNFLSFFLFLFHPTGRLFPRLEFGVAALRKVSLLWGTHYLLRSLFAVLQRSGRFLLQLLLSVQETGSV